MNDKLRVGIAGASGWMAGALSVGVEYDEQGFDPKTKKGTKSRFSVVGALCDLNENVMHTRKQELGLENARCFTSYDEMLASDAVDAVVVAVPNHLHVAFALKALKAGKHLFLEKPFATTWEDSQRLINATAQTAVTTKLDYILVLYDEQQKLRQLIDRGAFGKLASTHFTYRHPIQASQSADQIWKLSRQKSGGAVPMGICHAISLTVYQVNEIPQTVICKSCPPKIRAFDYDTQMDILVVFENHVVALVQGNIDFAEKYDARHTIIGTEGQFDYNPYNPLESRVVWSSKSLGRAYGPDPDFAQHHLDSGDVWKHQCVRTVQDFVRHALKKEKDPLLGLESPLVRRTEAVIWAAEQSAREGSRPVAAAAFLG
ncbi:MAG: Gfo/Idh/MocA family oxidoreductase [Verrucomicrobia bacterium]|nr:Gfo/Idh/MocA family oxidoreductase [Verrucomicrobiota bacterium]